MRGIATPGRIGRARMRVAGEAGFTLLELLISMSILLIVITSLLSVLVSASHAEFDANLRFQAQLQDRTALDKLRRGVHCAKAVTYDTMTAGNLTPLTVGTAYDAVTTNLPGTCPTAIGGATTYVTWCTSPSTLKTGDWALYRVASTTLPPATCATAGKVKWADYLTTQNPFCVPDSSHACGTTYAPPTSSLPMLHVTLPVNLNGPLSTKDSYNLVDDVVLRNGTRP